MGVVACASPRLSCDFEESCSSGAVAVALSMGMGMGSIKEDKEDGEDDQDASVLVYAWLAALRTLLAASDTLHFCIAMYSSCSRFAFARSLARHIAAVDCTFLLYARLSIYHLRCALLPPLGLCEHQGLRVRELLEVDAALAPIASM